MRLLTPIICLCALGALAACGGSDSGNVSDDVAASPAATSSSTPSAADVALTDIELEQGIGPIRDLELGPVDAALAAEGETAFTQKCSACHKLSERYVAPPLGNVLSQHPPEFVMNMMLNATEMVQRHPDIKQLLAEYYTPMTIQVTEEREARAILEYLRSAQTADAPVHK